MILSIDNLDGLGPVDYTATMDASEPFEVIRTLNAPSLLKGLLCLVGTALPTPARRGRVVLSTDAGTVLFTGFLTAEPTPIYAGAASAGSVYRLALSAVSDEWLLDKQLRGTSLGAAFGVTGQALFATLGERLDPGALIAPVTGPARELGVFDPSETGTFAQHCGVIAAATYASYRALNGALALAGIASTQHPLSDGDGSLEVSALHTASIRELANDVTVTGAEEPRAYWTELFKGDGTTAIFPLLGESDAPSAGHAALIAEPFNAAALNTQLWQKIDPGAYCSLTGSGFSFTGGTGFDGQTTLSAWDPLEVGGTVVCELASVMLSAGSAGVLGGLYNGATLQADCLAGFNIRQSGGNTIATPLIDGVEAGTSMTIVPGHQYTLRIHLNAPELLRVRQAFYALDDTGTGAAVAQFGGGTIDSPLSLVFEARDLSASSNTPVTVLYDGTSTTSPAQVNVVPVNSLSLAGSVGAIHLTRTGSCWIRSTPPSAAPFTRLAGKATDGVDCSVTSSVEGKVTFFAGRIPVAGEIVAVSYRGRQRAVARVADPVSIAAEAAGGGVGTARWLGHVVTPPARSTEDCENAAQAILSFATNRSAATSGSYTTVNPPTSDIWPGDVLNLSQDGVVTNCIVRKVALSQQGASPEALTYRIAFANDWAEALSLTVAETLPTDALLPIVALGLVSGEIPAHTLSNLTQLTIAPASGSLTIDAGVAPAVGGGFEVRRRDSGFGTGTTSTSSGDLVLRSPVRGFSIPLAGTPPETFYVRMYDASVPPLYSRQSTAILTQLT